MGGRTKGQTSGQPDGGEEDSKNCHISSKNSYTFVVLFPDPTKQMLEFSLNLIHLGEAI